MAAAADARTLCCAIRHRAARRNGPTLVMSQMTNLTQPAMIPGAREPGRPALAPTVAVAIAAPLTADAPSVPVPPTGGALSRLMLAMVERLISLLRTAPAT